MIAEPREGSATPGSVPARAAMLRRRIATSAARERVALALYESLVDGLEFGPRDVPSSDDREWLRRALCVCLPATADAALDLVAWRVAKALDTAPDGLGDRYDRSHEWEELGWE